VDIRCCRGPLQGWMCATSMPPTQTTRSKPMRCITPVNTSWACSAGMGWA